MNARKFFIAMGLLSVVLLAGCQNSAPINGNSKGIKDTSQYSGSDQTAYDGAIRLKDAGFCDKIENSNYKQECKTAVNDKIIFQDAVTKLDASMCAKLSTGDGQKTCKLQIEVALKEQADEKKQEQARLAEQKLASTIIQSGDYARCKELKIEGNRNDCEMNILTSKAIQTKDLSWCDKASTPENKQQCRTVAAKVK